MGQVDKDKKKSRDVRLATTQTCIKCDISRIAQVWYIIVILAKSEVNLQCTSRFLLQIGDILTYEYTLVVGVLLTSLKWQS